MDKLETVCKLKNTCSGCSLWDLPYEQQKTRKINNLQGLLESQHLNFSDIHFLSPAKHSLRDRLDFTWLDGNLGLYQKDSRQILDISECLQLSPKLQEFYTDFRKIKWPITKASFRLRVGPDNQKGLWIDAANIDIKKLIDEGHILKSLLDSSITIEMGQKRKSLLIINKQLKLTEPVSQHWFKTWLNESTEIFLNSQIASFTQPSMQANKLIAKTLQTWVSKMNTPRCLEFGSGIGNLSFSILEKVASLHACEIDKLALESFTKTLREVSAELRDKVEIISGDFQRKHTGNFRDVDLVLCNPPRSGLMNFTKPLLEINQNQKPRWMIYMSCFPESLAADLQTICLSGYSINELVILDQFPQTDHYEVLTLLERK